MQKSLSQSFALAMLAGLVGGCANQSTPEPVLLEDTDDEILEDVVHVTRDIQRQWGVTNRLSSIRYDEENPTLQISRLDKSLRRTIAFPGGYQETLEDLVIEMSTLSGYDYLEPAGDRPVRRIPIFFDEEYRTLGEYLYDAGQQAGSRADVVIDMKSNSLQIIYKGF